MLLGLTGRADTNRDGTITYDELFRFVRREMEKYPHQPQLLAPPLFALDQAVLGDRSPELLPSSTPAPDSGGSDKVRVKLEKPNSKLESKLRAIPEVQIVELGPFDMLVQTIGTQWRMYDGSGVLIQAAPDDDAEKLLAYIRGYRTLSRLRNWSNPGQRFNVRLDVEPEHAEGYDRFRTTFRINEKAKFRIATESPAYLLLLDINKEGNVSVLFPGPSEKERGLQEPNSPVEFAVPITAPAGSDQLKLIAFAKRPDGWESWSCNSNSCPDFNAADTRMAKLMSMLEADRSIAETSLRVVTEQ